MITHTAVDDESTRRTLAEIKSGKYRGCYLIYSRKSTDEPESQKNSIAYQNAENGKYAHREKLPVAAITLKGFCVNGVISEKHSGFKEDNDITITPGGLVQYRIDRPKFQRVIQYLSQGRIKGVICLCWDRISRNKGDDTAIRKLMKKGVDVRFVFATYEKTSAGALHMDIDGMFAQHHSRVTSEKVSTATRNLRERGICTYRAPIGYLNQGQMEHKPFDPERAPIIKRLFELYATGDWSLSDLARWAGQEGLTTVPMRRRRTHDEMLAEEDEATEIAPVSRPLTTNHVHTILTSPFYTGKVLGNGGAYVPSNSHQPLVTPELFDAVQRALRSKKVSFRYKELLDVPYRGLVRCAECTRVYTPYMKKGIQYFGARCRPGCPNQNNHFNRAFLEEKVGGLMSHLYFTDDELAEINARATTDIALLEGRRHTELEDNERKKKKVREDLAYLHNNRLTLLRTGVYSAEAFLAEENRLNVALASLQAAEQASDASMHEVIKDVVRLSELLKDARASYGLATPGEKEQIMRVIFSELCVSGNTLRYKCKEGFQALEGRFVAKGDPTTWLSDLLRHKENVTLSLRELEGVMGKGPLGVAA